MFNLSRELGISGDLSYLNHLHVCRMTGKAQGLIYQLQISAMDEFTDMETVNNEDWLTVYQNKKEIYFQSGRLEK